MKRQTPKPRAAVGDYEERLALGYVIDICCVCGRHATYPFCAHRSTEKPWTVPIAVRVINRAVAWRDGDRIRRRLEASDER